MKQFTKESALQVIEVGETFTVTVSVCGKAYWWGDTAEMLHVPSESKIKQISVGETHAMFLTVSGDLYSND